MGAEAAVEVVESGFVFGEDVEALVGAPLAVDAELVVDELGEAGEAGVVGGGADMVAAFVLFVAGFDAERGERGVDGGERRGEARGVGLEPGADDAGGVALVAFELGVVVDLGGGGAAGGVDFAGLGGFVAADAAPEAEPGVGEGGGRGEEALGEDFDREVAGAASFAGPVDDDLLDGAAQVGDGFVQGALAAAEEEREGFEVAR